MYHRREKLELYIQNSIQTLVDQLNNSQLYSYSFDQKQEYNVKNAQENVTRTNEELVSLQKIVKSLDDTLLLKDKYEKVFSTKKADINSSVVNKLLVADNTNLNKLTMKTSDGLSSINFSGKSQWDLKVNQNGSTDSLTVDQLDNKNILKNYMWLSDGTVGFNDNKLKISNKWTGYPDNATDKSEISNDINDFKKLMLVGNKSSGEGIRKVGVWDKLNVYGNINVYTGNKENTKNALLINNGKKNILNLKNDGELQLARKDGMVTQFDVNGKNNIRGKSYVDDITISDKLCINGICIDKNTLKAIKTYTKI